MQLLKQKVHLIDVYPGVLTLASVCSHTAPNLILNDQHTDLFQLVSQFLDVIAYHAVGDVHVGAVIEHIEGTGNVDFQRGSNRMGFLFVLLHQGKVQVFQERNVLRDGILNIGLVHLTNGTVDHGLLDGLESFTTTDDQLKQGQDEVALEG